MRPPSAPREPPSGRVRPALHPVMFAGRDNLGTWASALGELRTVRGHRAIRPPPPAPVPQEAAVLGVLSCPVPLSGEAGLEAEMDVQASVCPSLCLPFLVGVCLLGLDPPGRSPVGTAVQGGAWPKPEWGRGRQSSGCVSSPPPWWCLRPWEPVLFWRKARPREIPPGSGGQGDTGPQAQQRLFVLGDHVHLGTVMCTVLLQPCCPAGLCPLKLSFPHSASGYFDPI